MALVLVGCASVDAGPAFDTLNGLVVERTGKPVGWQSDATTRDAAEGRAKAILTKPVSSDAAVQLAFLRNPAIQVQLARIGIAEADVVQAGRLINPTVSISRVATTGIVEIERQILFSVLSLFTIGPRTRIAQDQAELARYQTALAIVQKAGQVKRAWVESVAARERVAVATEILEAAKAAEDLAQRMSKAGNMTGIDLARMKVNTAETATQLGKLRMAADMTRERLTRAMGLWGEATRFKLPGRLPRLTKSLRNIDDIERYALIKRLDVQAARKEVDVLRRSLDLTKQTAWLNVLEVSGKWDTAKESGKRTNPTGFEVEFSIPIFDLGDAKVDRSIFQYMQAVEALKSQAITARSEVREAWRAYRGTYDLARNYESRIEPLMARITEEELLRYNGMLIGVFELLAATKKQAQSRMAAIDARRDFWLAETQFHSTLIAGSEEANLMASISDAPASQGAEEH